MKRSMQASVPPVEPGSESSPTGVLERSLAIIEMLAANAQGMPLHEIADRLGVPRSATHRILTSLAEHGYVLQDRQLGAYRLTARIASLAFTFLAGSGIADLAQPILDALARESGELVRLAMVDGRQLIWVAKSQGAQHGLRYDPDMGQIARLSCSASGIAWLSCLPDDEALALVEKQGFGMRNDYGPKAPETPQALLKVLRATRKRGFSLVVQTYSPWMSTIAAVVRSPGSGEITGTVNVAGPHMRLTEARMLALAPALLRAADDLALATVASPPSFAPRSQPAGNFFVAPVRGA